MKSGSRPLRAPATLPSFLAFGSRSCGAAFARGALARRAALRLCAAGFRGPDLAALDCSLALLLECQTLFLSAAISSRVRPVTAEFGISSRMSGSDFLRGEFVGRLDQEPRLLPFARALAHAHQMPVALQLLAVQLEIEMALLHALVRIVLRRPGAAVPDHHGAAAVLAFRDGAFELVVFDRMILDVDGKALLAGHEARARASPPSSASRRRAQAADRSAAASRRASG